MHKTCESTTFRTLKRGPDGQAYQSIVKPFREVEDAALMGPMVGGLARQLKLTTKLIRKEKASSENDLKNAVGGL